MEKTETKYNRKEFVDNFGIITNYEYDLLPLEVQMAYLDSIYGYKVEEARTREDKNYVASGYGYVKPKYAPYFEANGCTFENFDFGKEEYEVKCVDKTKKLEISEDAKEKLEYFLNTIGNAKADAFESRIRRYYQDIIDAMEKGEEVVFHHPDAQNVAKKIIYREVFDSDSELDTSEKNIIIEAELSLMFSALENGEITANDLPILPESYIEVLKSMVESANLSRDDSKQLTLN